jgi:hypothetical protein
MAPKKGATKLKPEKPAVPPRAAKRQRHTPILSPVKQAAALSVQIVAAEGSQAATSTHVETAMPQQPSCEDPTILESPTVTTASLSPVDIKVEGMVEAQVEVEAQPEVSGEGHPTSEPVELGESGIATPSPTKDAQPEFTGVSNATRKEGATAEELQWLHSDSDAEVEPSAHVQQVKNIIDEANNTDLEQLRRIAQPSSSSAPVVQKASSSALVVQKASSSALVVLKASSKATRPPQPEPTAHIATMASMLAGLSKLSPRRVSAPIQ